MHYDCGWWINFLSHRLKKKMNSALADLGITGVQSRILHYILERYEEQPVFQKDVEEVFGLSRSTMTGILQLLEKNGIIIRESVDYDARLKSLVPTQKAVDIDTHVKEYIQQMEANLCRDISPGQLQVFLEVAEKMSKNLERVS